MTAVIEVGVNLVCPSFRELSSEFLSRIPLNPMLLHILLPNLSVLIHFKLK